MPKVKSNSRKLEMVPVGKTQVGMTAAATAGLVMVELPKGLKKLSAPALLKIEHIPIGQIVSGEIIRLHDSISARADMKDSKLILMKHDNGTEFLLPLTGVIKKAIGGNDGVTANVGKKLFLVRQPDGETTKYGGTKKVFMVDVYIKD